MSFEKFDRHGESLKKRASIWTNGTISISAGAVHAFGLREKMSAYLHYDRLASLIGLQITTEPTVPGALKITMRPSGAVIQCRTFLKHSGVDFSVASLYPLAFDPVSRWLVIDLKPVPCHETAVHPQADCVRMVTEVLDDFLQERSSVTVSGRAKGTLAALLFSLSVRQKLDRSSLLSVLETLSSGREPVAPDLERAWLALHAPLASANPA